MYNLKVVLLELETPTEQLLVVVGHPLEKSEGAVVCINRNYHSPKYTLKCLTARTNPNVSFSMVDKRFC